MTYTRRIGYAVGMSSVDEKLAKEERAARLRQARIAAGFKGPKSVSDATGININNVKAYESGRNGFGLMASVAFAQAFKCSLMWLMYGRGTMIDNEKLIPYGERVEKLRQEAVERLQNAEPEEVGELYAALSSVPLSTEETR